MTTVLGNDQTSTALNSSEGQIQRAPEEQLYASGTIRFARQLSNSLSYEDQARNPVFHNSHFHNLDERGNRKRTHYPGAQGMERLERTTNNRSLRVSLVLDRKSREGNGGAASALQWEALVRGESTEEITEQSTEQGTVQSTERNY